MSINVKNLKDIDYVAKATVENLNQPIQEEDSFVVKPNDNEIKEVVNSNDKYIPIADDKFVSIDLPSKFIFYPFKELKIRKLNIRDASKLTTASNLKTYKSFKEAIQCCINQDVDVLSLGDFKFICYWLRANSYPKTPITVSWTSRYGNKLVTPILKDKITTLLTDITAEQYKEYYARGIDVPRMKFADIYNDDLDYEQSFLYANAIYMKGDTWEEKLSNLEYFTNDFGLEAISELQDFDKLIEHGVEEKVTVVDTKFDLQVYKQSLQTKLSNLKQTLDRLPNDSSDYIILEALQEKLMKEFDIISLKEAKGEVVQAEPETIFLEMGPDELLSPLHTKGNK